MFKHQCDVENVSMDALKITSNNNEKTKNYSVNCDGERVFAIAKTLKFSVIAYFLLSPVVYFVFRLYYLNCVWMMRKKNVILALSPSLASFALFFSLLLFFHCSLRLQLVFYVLY